MFKFVLLAVVGVAVAQDWTDWLQGVGEALGTIDNIHGYKVQYDDSHDIFLFVNSDNCYIIEANNERWDDVVHNQDALYKFTETVYDQIQTQTGVTQMSHEDAINAYHSRLEQWECRHKDVFKIAFQRPATDAAVN